jgi:acetyl-CoA C-acetyltransferase
MTRSPWSGEVAVAGVCESPRRKAPGVHPYAIHAEVIRGALEDAGLEIGDVDGFCSVASMPTEGGRDMDLGEIAEYVGIHPRWFDSTDIGGAAFISHAGHAALAIASGLCEVVVVSYAAAGRSWPFPFADIPSSPYGPGQWEVPYGANTVAYYALAARRHIDLYGTTAEQLAQIAVQCRANAGPNENAIYRDPITVEDVLASGFIADPLHKLDCCVVTDSGAAFVLTSRKRAERLSRKPVYVLGAGEALGQVHISQMDDPTRTVAASSGADALERAGVSHSEIDCAQIYDSFTYTVLVTLESLGFCQPGEGGPFVASGAIAPDGRLPINTDGGGLSSNHPGRRGALALIEGVRQLRGESPGVQLAEPRICLVHGTGGFLSATATLVLGT